jgi:hypothetical protein
MATTLYMRDLSTSVNNYNWQATERGITTQTITINTTGINAFITGNTWASKPLAPFTLAGSISVNVRASESAAQANCGIQCYVYKWARATNTLSAALLTLTQAAELSTTDAAVLLTGTPTSTVFASGDMLVIEIGIINIGNMGSGRTVAITYNGATAAAAGDTYITITETVPYNRRTVVTD